MGHSHYCELVCGPYWKNKNKWYTVLNCLHEFNECHGPHNGLGTHDIRCSEQLTFFVTTEPRDSSLCTCTAYSIYLEQRHTKQDNSSQGMITLTDKTELQSISVSDPALSVEKTSQHGHIFNSTNCNIHTVTTATKKQMNLITLIHSVRSKVKHSHYAIFSSLPSFFFSSQISVEAETHLMEIN